MPVRIECLVTKVGILEVMMMFPADKSMRTKGDVAIRKDNAGKDDPKEKGILVETERIRETLQWIRSR